jgi:hypothetical protein
MVTGGVYLVCLIEGLVSSAYELALLRGRLEELRRVNEDERTETFWPSLRIKGMYGRLESNLGYREAGIQFEGQE